MMNFLKEAFSDNGVASSSRIFTAIAVVASICWVTHVVVHAHDLPDPVKLTALTAFSTAHYAVNRFSQKNGGNGASGAQQ